ncbi:branched-chain amino acid ABC transporter permease [Rhodoligotrophos ferricapiens]|uniref:branched-chain amino acid ABC transporter permease n=1 Tax=Rhodoligotrophos ferricapiens TaxID=3069264 RepID=UPI00315C7797
MTPPADSLRELAKPTLPIRLTAWGLIALIMILGACVPLLAAGSPFIIVLASQAIIAALLALSLDLLTGNTGLLSFGHAAWYGFGAYAGGLIAKFVTADILLVVAATAVLAALVAVIVGSILTRQIGKTFAILTLAFSQILFALVFVADEWTGGEDGLQGIPIPTLFGFSIARPPSWYWLLYGTLVLFIVLAFALRLSPLGKTWLAIRENAERARFIGIDVNRFKLLAYVLSAAIAAIAGALFVLMNGAAAPNTVSWLKSGEIMMYVVLGGTGTIIGPVLGAIAFTFAEHYVSSLTDSWLIYFGALFVIVVIVAPGGLYGLAQRAWHSLAPEGRR